jgi:hypothetical protein
MVIVPLAYLIFVFRLIAGGIGQKNIWIAFVVLSTFIAIINLAMRPKPHSKKITTENKYPTRLQNWINSIKRKERSQYFKWNMSQNISSLFIETIAYHHDTSPDQVTQQILSGRIDLPSDILEYLQISLKPFARSGIVNQIPRNKLAQIWAIVFNQPPPVTKKSPLDINFERIISYLEEYLSINRGMEER